MNLEHALDTSADGFLSLDSDWRVVFSNKTAQALLGNETGIAGRSFWELFPGIDRKQTTASIETGGEFSAAHWIGAAQEVSIRVVGSAVWLSLIDQQLENATEMLRAVVEGSPLAIVRTDESGRVTLWNAAAERTLGYTAAAITGRPCPIAVDCGVEVANREIAVRRSDGSECEIVYSAAPLPGSAGDSTGHVLMFSDITERNRMRRRMEHSQKLESLGVLAGGVAHDFNNLLTGIMGNASLGLDMLEQTSDMRPLLEEIVHSSDRAAALTKQLLAYAGKGRFDTSRVDLTDLARASVKIANEAVPDADVRIHAQLHQDALPVDADPMQLQQVILNLITNGVEAVSEAGGGAIRLTTRIEAITEQTAAATEFGEAPTPGIYAVIEIVDTGIGMDAPTRARIFEPFFSTKFTGRGLGLPSVLGIVRRHRGSLSVESAPGRGSTFRVLLPLATTTVNEPAPAAPQDLSGEGLILVVDDEETVRTTARRALERLRYRVIMAEHGQAAVEALARRGGDIRAVILDLTMPVMGGEEALRHLTRIRPGLPVILTSGYSRNEAMQRMEGKGVTAFLQKPFTAEQVGQAVREALGGRA